MKLEPGDRIVVKFKAGPVMGYFMSYYNDYVTCTLDDEYRVYDVERHRVSKAPANIQIFEATKET